jgi:hypothetical protein
MVVVVVVKSAVPAVPVVVVKVTGVSTELGLDRVTGNTLFVPSVTGGALATETVGVSLALMVFSTVTTPNAAPAGALIPKLKVSAGSPSVSLTVAVRTKTLVTPTGIVMMPLAGTGMKVVPPSVL